MTIQPRKPAVGRLPVLAVCRRDGECLFAGELFDVGQLAARLAERVRSGRRDVEQIPPAVVACDDPGGLLADLDRLFGRQGAASFMLWQWSLNLRPMTVWLGSDAARLEALTPYVGWFGWSARRGTFKRKGGARRYLVFDPHAWTHTDEILDGYPGQRLVERIARFAADVQEYCLEETARPCMTAAAIAGQSLRDPRFWPAARRKVPRATNDRARESLPGNHYRLLALKSTGRARRQHGTVLELDQTAAHHVAALNQPFPASAGLFAWGRFYTPPRDLRLADCVADVTQLDAEHGLLLAAVKGAGRDPLALPAVAHDGVKWRHVWTNELAELTESGGRVLGVAAGWTSNETDEGLNAYAWHALEALQQADQPRKGWLKQALLATYGLLAARPRGFAQLTKWGLGEPMTVHLPDGRPMTGRLRRSAETETGTCNVIWRGLIEAKVRAETIGYARQLRTEGRRVLSLYADAVYITAGDGDPPARPGWRVAQELTGVQFTTPTSFVSDQVTKQPGTPREARSA